MLPQTTPRSLKRRVPPEKRQRVEMSCDYCKVKRCKCSRSSTSESCRACNENGKPCRTTKPRKQRIYGRIPATSARSQLGSLYPIDFEPSYYPFVQTENYKTTSDTQSPFPRITSFGSFNQEEEWDPLFSQRSKSIQDLFEDAMGLPRYIGPTGTFTFMCRLKQLGAVRSAPENPQTMGVSIKLYDVRRKAVDPPPRDVADMLVDSFFKNVHADYPTFHRALFQATYESMWSYLPETEPAWSMVLYMVFILGLEVLSDKFLQTISKTQKDIMKQQYLSKVKELLPDIISGCTLTHVQALMLYCRYLYIAGERDASWNIAGLAIRVAVAIGLHRNGNNTNCSPLERELRKRVWWNLYAFERIECSALGRASAIDDAECNVGVPIEGLLDMSDSIPLGHTDSQSQLLMILGIICKAQYGLDNLSQRQVDFAAGVFQRLKAWTDDLPYHLKLESQPPLSQRRSIILLHIQYHYIVTLLGRRFLEAVVMKRHVGSTSSSIIFDFANRCIESAKICVVLSQKLFEEGLFNSTTSFDVYFLKSSAMMLALGRCVDQQELGSSNGEIVKLLKACMLILKQCDEFSPTMRKFANVTKDFSQALVVAAELGERKETSGLEAHDSDNVLSTFSSVESNASGILGEIAGETIDRSDSLLDPIPSQWEVPDMLIPLNWDDIGN
ncbi:fungal-specific transcription factor domain-containing protein [Xylogone sp. PMI_703]|nr:fungal-specific transcription factor domain-containing protein [Xylogone sp. PMI_703]